MPLCQEDYGISDRFQIDHLQLKSNPLTIFLDTLLHAKACMCVASSIYDFGVWQTTGIDPNVFYFSTLSSEASKRQNRSMSYIHLVSPRSSHSICCVQRFDSRSPVKTFALIYPITVSWWRAWLSRRDQANSRPLNVMVAVNEWVNISSVFKENNSSRTA